MRELNRGSEELVSSAGPRSRRLARVSEGCGGIDVPRLSYNWEEMQTQALFCAGKAKLDSRMVGGRGDVGGGRFVGLD